MAEASQAAQVVQRQRQLPFRCGSQPSRLESRCSLSRLFVKRTLASEHNKTLKNRMQMYTLLAPHPPIGGDRKERGLPTTIEEPLSYITHRSDQTRHTTLANTHSLAQEIRKRVDQIYDTTKRMTPFRWNDKHKGLVLMHTVSVSRRR